jgi:hypothetical protein
MLDVLLFLSPNNFYAHIDNHCHHQKKSTNVCHLTVTKLGFSTTNLTSKTSASIYSPKTFFFSSFDPETK